MKIDKKIIIGAVVLVALIALSFYFFKGSNQQTSEQEGQQQIADTDWNVMLQEYSFNPNESTIRKGENITWQNKDGVVHNIKFADGFFNRDIQPGEVVVYFFNQSGRFNYSCARHPAMTGVIIVK